MKLFVYMNGTLSYRKLSTALSKASKSLSETQCIEFCKVGQVLVSGTTTFT